MSIYSRTHALRTLLHPKQLSYDDPPTDDGFPSPSAALPPIRDFADDVILSPHVPHGLYWRNKYRTSPSQPLPFQPVRFTPNDVHPRKGKQRALTDQRSTRKKKVEKNWRAHARPQHSCSAEMALRGACSGVERRVLCTYACFTVKKFICGVHSGFVVQRETTNAGLALKSVVNMFGFWRSRWAQRYTRVSLHELSWCMLGELQLPISMSLKDVSFGRRQYTSLCAVGGLIQLAWTSVHHPKLSIGGLFMVAWQEGGGIWHISMQAWLFPSLLYLCYLLVYVEDVCTSAHIFCALTICRTRSQSLRRTTLLWRLLTNR